MMGWRQRIRPMVAAGAQQSALRAHFWPLLGPNSARKQKPYKMVGNKNYLGPPEQSYASGDHLPPVTSTEKCRQEIFFPPPVFIYKIYIQQYKYIYTPATTINKKR